MKRNKEICDKCGDLKFARCINHSFYYNGKYGNWDKCLSMEADIVVCGHTGHILWYRDKRLKILKSVLDDCKFKLEQMVY